MLIRLITLIFVYQHHVNKLIILTNALTLTSQDNNLLSVTKFNNKSVQKPATGQTCNHIGQTE